MTEPYKRRANYYETDKMGVVHHSNYFRWMEEARLDFSKKNGISYAEMEKKGIMMPVTDISCHYRRPVRFDEEVTIQTSLVFFNGVRAVYRYQIYAADGSLAAEGESRHCFINAEKHVPMSLKRMDAYFYEAALKSVEEKE